MAVVCLLETFALSNIGTCKPLAAQEPSPIAQKVATGRSMVMTRLGIVSASQPLAAQAGADMLSRGGNAVDAAIAANAVLGLVEPHYNGIGGDLFAIYYEAKTPRAPSRCASTASTRSGRSRTIAPRSGTFGFGQAVMSNGAGTHFAGSEPRTDGAAIPQAAIIKK